MSPSKVTVHPGRIGSLISWILIASIAACAGGEGEVSTTEAPRLAAERELAVGSPDDPVLAFTWFRDLEVGPDGRIYTLHPQEGRIRIHDAEGDPVGTIGGPGQGPGEFDSPGAMAFREDTLWVLDYGTYRFSLFGPDGELLRDFRVPVDLGTPDRSEFPPRPRGLLSDGTILGSPPAFSRLVVSGELTESWYGRLGPEGRVLDTLARYSLVNTVFGLNDPDHDPPRWGVYRDQAFSDAEIVQVSEHAPELVRLKRPAAGDGGPTGFRVVKLGLEGDTLFHREVRYDPVPLDPAVVDSVAADFAGWLAESERLAEGRARRLARESLYAPPFHPPVSQVVLGRDGSVWLRREDTGEDRIDWLVLGPAGELEGVASLPKGLRVLEADRRTAWGMERDELDVPYIVRYRLTTEASGEPM